MPLKPSARQSTCVAVSDFEGYWNNEEADEECTRDGIYWSGDLGHMDSDGFVYSPDVNFDWLRVDGDRHRLLTSDDVAAIRDAFAARDRLHLL